MVLNPDTKCLPSLHTRTAGLLISPEGRYLPLRGHKGKSFTQLTLIKELRVICFISPSSGVLRNSPLVVEHPVCWGHPIKSTMLAVQTVGVLGYHRHPIFLNVAHL